MNLSIILCTRSRLLFWEGGGGGESASIDL